MSLQQTSSEQTSCRSPCSSTRRNKRGVPVTHGRSRPTTAKDESCEQVRLQTQAPYNGIHLLAYDRVVVLSDASC